MSFEKSLVNNYKLSSSIRLTSIPSTQQDGQKELAVFLASINEFDGRLLNVKQVRRFITRYCKY